MEPPSGVRLPLDDALIKACYEPGSGGRHTRNRPVPDPGEHEVQAHAFLGRFTQTPEGRGCPVYILNSGALYSVVAQATRAKDQKTLAKHWAHGPGLGTGSQRGVVL